MHAADLLAPSMYFGEVINVLWMRRGDRDRGSPSSLSERRHKYQAEALVHVHPRSSVRSGDDSGEGDVDDDDATRYIDTAGLQEDAIMVTPRKCLRG